MDAACGPSPLLICTKYVVYVYIVSSYICTYLHSYIWLKELLLLKDGNDPLLDVWNIPVVVCDSVKLLCTAKQAGLEQAWPSCLTCLLASESF